MLLKQIIFIGTLFIFSLNICSQEKLLLELNENIRFGGDGSNGYDFAFSVKSLDERFKRDTYLFNTPNWKTFDAKINLDELKKEVSFELENIINVDVLEKMDACETHEKFSLVKTIFLIKKQEGKYFYWKLTYNGTIKNIIISGYQGKI